MSRSVQRSSVFLLILMWVATGCITSLPSYKHINIPTPNAALATVASPELISHSLPNLVANTRVLEDAGCASDKYISWLWNCTSNAQLMALGCEEAVPNNLLAGLTPSYPVMRCSHSSGEPPNKARFKHVGCLASGYTSYVLFKGGAYQLITEESEFQSTFAPIESSDEALSYALVATDLVARYETGDDPIFHYADYFVEKVEDTHVEETTEGFVVHLFTQPTPLCGCGVHTVYAVDILVTKDGRVEQLNATEAYASEACID